ncbi:type II toxin-antitoxin system RelE/ParE family toxin [Rhizobium sp. C4]|uniref:type II toxin-antitoxin system RelE/ParE family toxin n=1 Tax=Rhizobium sp. C4 TaxID=1349800 RepID=UPI001E4D171E|nr:type II toxin-antitoxin system RelE/ParE family toxin [Rhizobium sp. C4]MCD2171373.1 type II toxin-antitoxin system RelE/ParE family toxin [Rhizobium sp. C4]
MKIIWLPRAVADLNAQIDYIAADNPKSAIDIGDRVIIHVFHLGAHPEMGRSGRRTGTRELFVPRTPFVVVYRIRNQQLEILRLLHGAQQWPPPA